MLIALAVALAPPAITPPKLFGDWYAACDNARHCAAVALLPEASDKEAEFWTLSIWRGPGELAPPELRLQVNFEVPDRMMLLIDGRPTNLAFGKDAKIVGTKAAEAAAQLVSARSMALVDRRGRLQAQVSARGASAALRWIDEKQGRAGTSTALVAKGSTALRISAEPLPTIRTSKRSSAAPATLSQAQMEKIRGRFDCGEVADTDVPEFHRLDQSTSVAIVPCSLASYEASSVIMLVSNDGSYRDAPFERAYSADLSVPPNELVSAGFNLTTLSLTTSYRMRGVGDCGSNEAYVWDGTRFRLAYQEIMEECRGSLERVPIWRTANVPSFPQ